MSTTPIVKTLSSCAMVALVLTIAAIVLVFDGERAAQAERIVYFDEADERQLVDNPTNIVITDDTVSFLHKGKPYTIGRDSMDARSLYELLLQRIDDSAESHYRLGLYCQWNERRGVTLNTEARKHFEEAAKRDRAYGPLVAERLSEIRELDSWTEFVAARESLIRDKKNAMRKLRNIVDDFEGTVGAREAAELIAALEAAAARDAEANNDAEQRNEEFALYLEQLRLARLGAENMLALGHRMMAGDDDGRSSDLPRGIDRNSPSVWIYGLDLLNGPRGVRAGLRELARTVRSDTPEARQILAFLDRVKDIEILLYRALGHFYLQRTNYEVAERHISAGMALDPFDREMVELQWMLDEYRRIVNQGSLLNQANQPNQPTNKNDGRSNND